MPEWRFAKPMSELTDVDFQTMTKENLKSMLGHSYVSYHGAAPVPHQRISLKGKLRKSSTMSHGQLVDAAVKTRNDRLARRRPFYTWDRRWTKHADPVVRWGTMRPENTAERQREVARELASRGLPTELVEQIAPGSTTVRPPKKKQKPPPKLLFERGDVLVDHAKKHFLKVTGHTVRGLPKMQLIYPRKHSETHVVPKTEAALGPAKKYDKSRPLVRWDGTPQQFGKPKGRLSV